MQTFKKLHLIVFMALGVIFTLNSCSSQIQDKFPDGTIIPDWFKNSDKLELSDLGTIYNIQEYGIEPDQDILVTKEIQNIINTANKNGGGVIVIPQGVYKSGALFFKPKTHLHLEEGAVLLGSDTIIDYPIQASRMEGHNLDYFPALINAYNVDGFSISGKGKIDGNGGKYWKAFWQRRKENRKCTNLEVSRPRLVFIWNSNDVQIQDVKLHNSGFWTTHLYQCKNVKILDANIFAPKEPIPAPSTDAIDIDVCTNVLVKGCYISVNDDAIALKGGKGPWADKDENNGPNFNILIENNHYGWCHSVITCGSESIHDRNVLMRNCTVDGASRLTFFKMRPDTPQKYEYITLENISGKARVGLYIRPWKQFFDLKGRETPPVSTSQFITLKDINMEFDKFAEVGITEYDQLNNFKLENINAKAENIKLDPTLFNGLELDNVKINGKAYLKKDFIK